MEYMSHLHPRLDQRMIQQAAPHQSQYHAGEKCPSAESRKHNSFSHRSRLKRLQTLDDFKPAVEWNKFLKGKLSLSQLTTTNRGRRERG